MFAIGDRISQRDLPCGEAVSTVASAGGSAIVRDHTIQELTRARTRRPEILGPFAELTPDEIRRTVQEYDGFIVEVGESDYRLVVGYKGRPSSRPGTLTVLLADPDVARTEPCQWVI